jgi:hypothetical protein
MGVSSAAQLLRNSRRTNERPLLEDVHSAGAITDWQRQAHDAEA